MGEPSRLVLQPLQIPQRVARRAEELSAHIIVDAENFVTQAVEVFDRLGANQSAASGDQDFHRAASLSKSFWKQEIRQNLVFEGTKNRLRTSGQN
jgi:hypothetical protein